MFLIWSSLISSLNLSHSWNLDTAKMFYFLIGFHSFIFINKSYRLETQQNTDDITFLCHGPILVCSLRNSLYTYIHMTECNAKAKFTPSHLLAFCVDGAIMRTINRTNCIQIPAELICVCCVHPQFHTVSSFQALPGTCSTCFNPPANILGKALQVISTHELGLTLQCFLAMSQSHMTVCCSISYASGDN